MNATTFTIAAYVVAGVLLFGYAAFLLIATCRGAQK